MSDKPHTRQYSANFRKGIRLAMAEHELKTMKAAAEWLDVGRVTLMKIMEEKQAPTVEQGIMLCLKGGYSADWMFLNESGPYNRMSNKVPTENNKQAAAHS